MLRRVRRDPITPWTYVNDNLNDRPYKLVDCDASRILAVDRARPAMTIAQSDLGCSNAMLSNNNACGLLHCSTVRAEQCARVWSPAYSGQSS